MNQLNLVKGVKDYLPPQAKDRTQVCKIFNSLAQAYGFEPIETPILEHLELFNRAVGLDTDVVGKEMYQFNDLNNEVLCLRPEATASVVRALINSGWLKQNTYSKLSYQGPMFRRERPQKGRYRQFTQLGLEVFGYDSYLAEIELISLCAQLWETLGISQAVTLEINNIGSTAERNAYKKDLVEFFTSYHTDLTPEQIQRLAKNPLRILDSKDDNIQQLINQAPKITDYLTAESQAEITQLGDILKSLGIEYKLNTKLVRGLDYYNNWVWEWTTELLGSQNTICAGGRYDSLVTTLGGQPTPAVGFSIGLERLVELAQLPANNKLNIIVFGFSKSANNFLTSQLTILRQALPEVNFNHHFNPGKPAKLFKYADKSNADIALFAGDEEITTHKITYKHLRKENQQQTLHRDELIDIISTHIHEETGEN